MEVFIEKVKAQLINALRLDDINPETINPDAPLFGEGLGLDSIDALELVVLLEKEYGITINNMDVAKNAFASLRSLTSFILEHTE